MRKIDLLILTLAIVLFISSCCGDCVDNRTNNFYIINNTDSTVYVKSNSFHGIDQIILPRSSFQKEDNTEGLTYAFGVNDSIFIAVGSKNKTDFMSSTNDQVNIFNTFERNTENTSNRRCCPSKLTKNSLTITQADIDEAQ